MAFPIVEGTATSATTTAGTNHTVTLPASIAASDLVLITMVIGSTSATINALTDWAELLDESSAIGLKIFYYTGAGVPGNPTFVSNNSTRDASISWRISGVNKSIAPQIGTTSTNSGTTPDPPASAAPPSTNDYLFITFCGSAGEQADNGSYCTGFPTSYTTNNVQKACGTVGTNLGGMIAAASRSLNTGSAADPGTFTVSENDTWRAQTILIHPTPNMIATGAVAFTTVATISAPGTLAATGAVAFSASSANLGSGAAPATDQFRAAITELRSRPYSHDHNADLFSSRNRFQLSKDISATGAIAFTRSADLKATGTLAATGAIVFASSSAALTSIGSLTATGALTFGSTATDTATGTLSATGAIAFTTGATISAPGTITATGAIAFGTGSANLTNAGSIDMSATGVVVFTSSAALTGTGTLAATGTVTFTTSAALDTGVRSDVFRATVINVYPPKITYEDLDYRSTPPHHGVVIDLSATGAITFTSSANLGSGVHNRFQEFTVVLLNEENHKHVIPEPEFMVVRRFKMANDTAATGAITWTSSAALTAQGTLAATGAMVWTSSANLVDAGTSDMAATGAITFAASSVVLRATGTLAATGVITFGASTTVSATGTLGATGAIVWTSTAILVNPTGNDLTATGAITFGSSSAAPTAIGTLTATGSIAFGSTATQVAVGKLNATGAIAFTTSAAANLGGTMAATGAIAFTRSASLTATGNLTATGAVVIGSTANASAIGSMSAAPTIAFISTATISARGTLAATGAMVWTSSTAITYPGADDAQAAGHLTFGSSARLLTADDMLAYNGGMTFHWWADLTDGNLGPMGEVNHPGNISGQVVDGVVSHSPVRGIVSSTIKRDTVPTE